MMTTGNRVSGLLRVVGGATLATAVMASPTMGQESSTAQNSASTLPITEVTAFKDGHALIVRSGSVKTNAAGDVVLKDLPRPLLGTFWADESEVNADLRAVTSSIIELSDRVEVGSLMDLLAQNIGARIEYKDIRNHERHGVLRDVLEAGGSRVALIDETMGIDAPSSDGEPHDPHDHPGTRIAAIPLDNMRDVRFVGSSPTTTAERTYAEARMTLDLEWEGTPEAEADISLMAVERGLRWIPAYRITMLGDDRVLIELEATLVNDFADLYDTRVHMAVGVPSFAFAGQDDPMALLGHLAALGQAYPARRDAGLGGRSSGAMLGNALMSQVSGSYNDFSYAGERNSPSSAASTTPEAGGSEQAEDLYVFTIEHLTLDKGARMALPLASYECDAESIYKLDLIAAPPLQAMQNFNTQKQRELATALDRPTARHILRITNDNELGMPFTTAPALILKNGRTLAQGLMRYTSEGAKADLEVGVALDLTVSTEETETGRDREPITWGSYKFGRIDIGFTGCITNRKNKPITIEIRKLALGQTDSVSEGGTGVAINLLSDSSFWSGSMWANGYSWPRWWHGVNSATRYEWTLEVEPGEAAEFEAAWHYYWR